MTADNLKEINRIGEALIRAIQSLVQTARMHHDSNQLMVETVAKFQRVIAAAQGAGASEVSLRIANQRFYFQDEKVIVRAANAKLCESMERFFENRGIHGLHFDGALTGAGNREIVAFAKLLDLSGRREGPADWLSQQLTKRGWHWISIDQSTPQQMEGPPAQADPASPPSDSKLQKMKVRRCYSKVLGTVRQMALKMTANQPAGMRQSVRLVQNMVDIITEDEALFLGISTIRVYDDYTYTHSLNVAILSMCLGNRIGLPRRDLERLGLCGLFHDLGKIEIPKAILNKKGKLDQEELLQLKSHTMHSARLILKLRAETDRKIKILVPPFEHHVGYDHSGYPKVAGSRPLSLFGRILTIADVYDAITSPRIYRPSAMSPDEALRQMRAQSGTHFDPILLKVFIQMLGAYPVGTLLKLDTNEFGIVAQACESGRFPLRPRLQLLTTDAQGNYVNGQMVDLSDKDLSSGRYLRNVVGSMHPATMKIQPARFLLQ